MLNETFYLDGVDAKSVGIHLQSPIVFSEAVPVIEAQTIPGRNGDLIWETGSYENRSGSASCYCLQKYVDNAVSSAGRFLMGKRGYRRLETSDDPNHYWMARVENSPKIDMRAGFIAPFDVDFNCKPQRFLKNGETPLVFKSRETIFNYYGQTALPFITVYGKGSGWITIGKTTISITSIEDVLYLDSETQNAYNVNGNQNRNIIAPVFPVLQDGESVIAWGGDIERVEIVPRWWEL